MFTPEEELRIKKKEFGRNFFVSLLGVFLTYNLLLLLINLFASEYKLVIPQKILLFSLFAVGYIAYLISQTEFDFWPIYKIITASLAVLVFYISLVLCHKSSAILAFYIPITLMVLMLSSIKTTAVWASILLVICYFTPDISEALNIAHPTQSTDAYLKILTYLEYIVLFFASCLSFLILYYYDEFNKIEIKRKLLFEKHNQDALKKGNIVPQPEAIDIIDDQEAQQKPEKFEELYKAIIDYMDTEKPFQDSYFTINKLAKSLDTNATYVSKALNQIGNKSFHELVNGYRIDQVRRELSNDAYKKFTMEHIYARAGFRQQSTFNRIFKDIIGITPSEFIENKEDSDNYFKN